MHVARVRWIAALLVRFAAGAARAQLAYDDASVYVTAFGFVPTRGGFEINADRSLEVGIAGGGATSNSVFGYSRTATGGRKGIGTMLDLSLAVQATKNLALAAYYAHVFGCGMIDQAFLGNDSSYAYAETTLAF